MKGNAEQPATFNRFQKKDALITQISAAIIPGAGHIYFGMTFRGFIYVYLFIFTIIYLLAGNNLIYTDSFFYNEKDLIQKIFIVVFIVVIYSLSIYKIYKIKNRG